MDRIEMVAAGLGLTNIVFVVLRSAWNFPAAIAMAMLYTAIFFEARLYSDAGLQIFFVAANLYGWWAWHRELARSGEVRVRRLAPASRAGWGAAVGLGAAALGTAMDRLTDAVAPYPDAFVAVASVAAQILLARRVLENWYLWILVDLVAIAVYLSKELTLTAMLYALFLLLCLAGLAEWRRAPREARPA